MNLKKMNTKVLVGMLLTMMLMITVVGCSQENAEALVDEYDSMTDLTLEDGVIEDVSEYVISLGEGEKQFTFTVTFEDATMNVYEISTDATTVGDALVELDLIDGDDSEYGMYVTTVAGVTLNWDTDAAYWAFYIDGEMAMSGVDTTDIVEGSIYTLAYAE